MTIGRVLLTSVVSALVVVPASFAGTAALNLSPSVVTLGRVPVGTTSEDAVTLTNSGSETLTLISYEVFGYNGNFTINPGSCLLGTTLAPGETCTFSILTSPFGTRGIRGEFCYSGVGETTSVRECGRIVGGASRE